MISLEKNYEVHATCLDIFRTDSKLYSKISSHATPEIDQSERKISNIKGNDGREMKEGNWLLLHFQSCYK